MRDELFEKLDANNRRRVLEMTEKELFLLKEKGFVYDYAQVKESRELLDLILSNELEGTTVEIDLNNLDEVKKIINATVKKIKPVTTDEIICLFHEKSEEVGALKVSLIDCLFFLDDVLKFIKFDKGELMNSFMIIDLKRSFGICLFHTEYEHELFYFNDEEG